ncbi:RNA polymerase sigma factor [Marseilla massiliensis]|uniref:Sigma-70 family RNA polymerase sigma factor n=1 Tax=Marseilla massiliensis TaxID=1841864 RepID=A0A938WTD0_9BACT|nr:sigma-70 family RNA polymerase sigma factor [Marseilla massiliensis]MBM6673799.1 sigma-70 family RNA polymerase sigma factor [Marseilla massiliensis]
MDVLKIYTEDLKIAQAIINRDDKVTRFYLYKKCYPLFKSIYNRYYTDCVCCKEFIDEIYVLILTPSKETGRCQLEHFRGESSLVTWLKTISLFYCYKRFKIKKLKPEQEPISTNGNGGKDMFNDRKETMYGSIEIDVNNLNREDIQKLLDLMPNSSYRKLIRLRYFEQKNNEETARILGVTMGNYYNMHKRAKEQFTFYCRKEESHG